MRHCGEQELQTWDEQTAVRIFFEGAGQARDCVTSVTDRSTLDPRCAGASRYASSDHTQTPNHNGKLQVNDRKNTF